MSPLFFKRLSDEVLGSRLASGEAAAFDELYRRYSNRLAAYGAHLLGDIGLGDDVAQATMLKAYGALRAGRVPDHMKPWLFRIAHNVAIDLVIRRRELPSDDLPESPTADREPFTGTLVAALATLPDRQRRVYVLREVHGLRIDETAAELGLTASQVEQSLFAARNRLAEQLVFGDRLNCVTVQRLAAGPLDAAERRALKTHLRTCDSCRATLGLRGRALTIFPAGISVDWLARLGPGLLTGGAPAAAKVGAVVATATIAAGVPVAVEQSAHRHAHRPIVPSAVAVHETPVVSVRAISKETLAAAVAAPTAVAPAAAAVAVSAPRTAAVMAPRSDHHGSSDSRGRSSDVSLIRRGHGSGSVSEGSAHHGSEHHGGVPTSIDTESRHHGSDGGGSDGGGSDGGRSDGGTSDGGSGSGHDGPGSSGSPTVDTSSGGDRSGRDGGGSDGTRDGGTTGNTDGKDGGGDRDGGGGTTTSPTTTTTATTTTTTTATTTTMTTTTTTPVVTDDLPDTSGGSGGGDSHDGGASSDGGGGGGGTDGGGSDDGGGGTDSHIASTTDESH